MNKNIMFYYIILALNQVLRGLKIMKKNSYSYNDLITCGNGELFGPGNAKLPLPPMLMFDRITEINENKGIFCLPDFHQQTLLLNFPLFCFLLKTFFLLFND